MNVVAYPDPPVWCDELGRVGAENVGDCGGGVGHKGD